MAKKYINKSKLLGKIGTENYKVSNCPVHLPKENINFFMAMQNAGNEDPFSADTYSNLITPSWKKSIYESVMNTVSKEVKKVLNESNGCRTYEECLRANLVCLYDHCDQLNFYIIKNPTIEDIKEIGEYHNRYYWHKKDTDNPKDRIVAEFLQWAYYNIKLDGLTSIEYDDENINLCSFDLNDDNELYKLVYDAYSIDENEFRHKIGWDRYNFNIDNKKIDYILNIINQNILNMRDSYGFGIGMRESFIEYFFQDYKEILDRYNNGDKEGDPDWLKRIKEKEKILSSYESFKSYMKEQVKKSFCGGDSSQAILLLNLKTELIFDKAPKTNIHFIKSFQEYKDEMYKILTNEHKIKESQEFDFNNALLESAWGYEPNESDSTLDEIGNLYDDLTEVVYDKCKKLLIKRNAYVAWDVIAIIEHYFEKMPLLNTINDKKSLYWKYYCWWRLKETKNKDILELYEQAIKKCEADQKWLNTWNNPEEIQASLQKRRNLLNRYLKIQMKSEMNEGFMFEGECGGIEGTYNTPMNTVGVGNVVPAGIPGMAGAQLASDMFNGSGDLTIPKSQKKSKKQKSKNSGVTYFPLATKKGV